MQIHNVHRATSVSAIFALNPFLNGKKNGNVDGMSTLSLSFNILIAGRRCYLEILVLFVSELEADITFLP